MTAGRQIGRYLIHVGLATFATWIIAAFLVVVASSTLNSRAIEGLADQPFIAQIVVGFFIGLLVNFKMKSKSAMWVWVPALIWMLLLMTDDIRTPELGGVFHTIWIDMFSTNHGDLGLGGTLGTSVLYGSVAYSLGSWLGLKLPHAPPRLEEPVGTRKNIP